MIALSADSISLSFGAEEILRGITFSVNDGGKDLSFQSYYR